MSAQLKTYRSRMSFKKRVAFIMINLDGAIAHSFWILPRWDWLTARQSLAVAYNQAVPTITIDYYLKGQNLDGSYLMIMLAVLMGDISDGQQFVSRIFRLP